MPSCGRDTSRYVPATIRGDGLDRPRGPSNPIVGEASPRPTIKQQFLDGQKNGFLVLWFYRKRPFGSQPLAQQPPSANPFLELIRVLPELGFLYQQYQSRQGISRFLLEKKQFPVGGSDIPWASPQGFIYPILEYKNLLHLRGEGKKAIFQVVQGSWWFAQKIPCDMAEPPGRFGIDGFHPVDQRLVGRNRSPRIFAPETCRAFSSFNTAKLDFQGIGTQAADLFHRQDPNLSSKFVGDFPLGTAASPRLFSFQLSVTSKYFRYFDAIMIFQKRPIHLGRLTEPARQASVRTACAVRKQCDRRKAGEEDQEN